MFRAMSTLRCSFCAKKQHAVRKLAAGPNVLICDECVAVCVDIISDDGAWVDTAVPAASETQRVTGGVRCGLCGMLIPAEDALLIEHRGPLCPGCVSAIEATIAAERDIAADDGSGGDV